MLPPYDGAGGITVAQQTESIRQNQKYIFHTKDADKKVITRVWKIVDGIVDEVKRIEDKDLVTVLPLKSKEIDFEGVKIAELASVSSRMNTGWMNLT